MRPVKVVVLGLLGVVLAGVIWLMWGLSQYTDGAEPGLVIDNRTDGRLAIYVVRHQADELQLEEVGLQAFIPAHTRQDSGILCAAGEPEARNQVDSVVARRPKSSACDMTPWVIESPPP